MTKLSYSGNKLVVNGKTLKLDFPVQQAFSEENNKVIVLYDPDANDSKFGQFQNLVAIDMSGVIIWKSELPTRITGDCYYKIISKDPLKALSFQSYECDIDTRTGKITTKKFLK